MNDATINSMMTSGTSSGMEVLSSMNPSNNIGGIITTVLQVLVSTIVPTAQAEEAFFNQNHYYGDYYRNIAGSSFADAVVIEQGIEDTDLQHALINVYESLASSQEPLGSAFEEVLYENFWDLCEA